MRRRSANDASRIANSIKPVIFRSFRQRFNTYCYAGINPELFADLLPYKLAPLTVAPLISSYTIRWDFDQNYEKLVRLTFAMMASSLDWSEEQMLACMQSGYIDHMRESVSIILKERKGKTLSCFIRDALLEGSKVYQLFLNACTELGRPRGTSNAENSVRRFARSNLEEALTLMGTRESVLSLHSEALDHTNKLSYKAIKTHKPNGFIERSFPILFKGTPENDSFQISTFFKPYLIDEFARQFETWQAKEEDALRNGSWFFRNGFEPVPMSLGGVTLTPGFGARMIALEMAPAISSYTCRWGFDSIYQSLVFRCLFLTGLATQDQLVKGNFSLMDFVETAISLITELRRNRPALEEFINDEISSDGSLFLLYLGCCVEGETAAQLQKDHIVVQFARARLRSALIGMKTREGFLSPYPKVFIN